MALQPARAQSGVVDSKGKFVIPLEHAWIEKVGKNEFLTHSVPRDSKEPDIEHLFDRNGHELDLSMIPPTISRDHQAPPGYTVKTAWGDGVIASATSDPQGKLGFFNSHQRNVIPCEFDILRYVAESRIFAMKHTTNGAEEYFLYDLSGHMVCALPSWAKNFDSYFSEGLMIVGDTRGRAFIDRNGRVVIPPSEYVYCQPFYCGLADVQFPFNGKLASGYINHKGKLVIGPIEDCRPDPFTRGLGQLTRTADDGSVKLGAVNTHGKMVFPIEFEPFGMSADKFVFGLHDGKYQLFKRNGKVVATLPTGTVAAFAYDLDKHELVPFNVGGHPPLPNSNTADDGKWGYCDKHGRAVIEPRFEFGTLFKGKLAVACVKDRFGDTKMGLIKGTGQWVVQPRYASVEMTATDRTIVFFDPLNGIEHAWHDPKKRSRALLAKTLELYDLFGQTEPDLERLLGKGEANVDPLHRYPEMVHTFTYYDLSPHVRCGNAQIGVEFGFDETGKVWGWRIRGFEKCQPWITENVKANPED